MSDEIRFEPIRSRPDDSSFIETRRQSVDQIAAAFGVPPDSLRGPRTAKAIERAVAKVRPETR